ncbi:MAG: hypothetical protein QM770_16585 [Tepidisphaeraceae bacterium]
MTMEPLGTVMVDVNHQTQWLLHSPSRGAFITGDENDAFAVTPTTPVKVSRLDRGQKAGAWNLPLPEPLIDEVLQQPWHGFKFLDRAAYANVESDLLRTLVFGPDYGLPVLHPGIGAILSFRSNAMQLLAREGDTLKPIEKTKPRGKQALCFAAHPTEPLVVYGDNFGTFTAHRFEPTAFGKATKVVAKERNASRAEFVDGGTKLLLGGMGYLALFGYEGGKFTPLHEVSVAVRDFLVIDAQTVLVNHGMNGVSLYRYAGGFTKLADATPGDPAHIVAVAPGGKQFAVTHQGVPKISVYRVG